MILGVSRAPSGPDFQGCRPVLVTFQLFKDRFDVLAAARWLRDFRVNLTLSVCHVSRAQGSWQQTLCDNCWGVQSEVTGRPAGAQKIHEGGEEKQPGEALQDSLWQTSCGRQSFHIQASLSIPNDICFVFICVFKSLNSEGKIIEEAKKKNDVNCLRCDTALSGQVEEVDKVRYCSHST